MIRIGAQAALLTTIYLIVLGSLDPWDVLLGGAFSVGVVLLLRGHVPARTPARVDPAWLPRLVLFVGAVIWEIIIGSWAVLGVVLRLRPLRQPGIVTVPIQSRTQVGLAVSEFVVTVAPGTYLLDVDRERRVMLVHALDAHDPEAIRGHFQMFYDRYQSKLFP